MQNLPEAAISSMATQYGLVEGTDYSINNDSKIITLTDSGFAKISAGSGSGSDSGSGTDAGDTEDTETYYSVYHGTETIETLPESELQTFKTYFTADEDYTIDNDSKKITLTDAGYKKYQNYKTLYGDTYTAVYGDETLSDITLALLSNLGLEENTDYTVDKSTKIITLLTENAYTTILNHSTEYSGEGDVEDYSMYGND